MWFSPDDVVFRICFNLEEVTTAEAALHAWLPLVAELRPRAMEFEEASPDGLRHGFLAELVFVSPLTGAGDLPDRLRASVKPLIERLGMDAAKFELNDEGIGGFVDSKDAEGTAYGAYLIFALIGADPFNPEGEEMDYEDTGEDLLPEWPR
ncbi:hypothetical protein [Streptomyces yerevanensis]|uniref:hypothetical protein n=1 Tax=Streptomyces yerevanensis TaxID=66378 RepID=UPI0005266DB7|nr:hypothetical protein [Streptomyces yerevanensis]